MDGAVELMSMWVAPRARGRGVGELLIAAVADWAALAGARTMLLAVAEGNTAAERLYRRAGFLPTGAQAEMPDGIRRERVMAKPLR
ncbi:MAG: GNAT family N-acetyltransferase [Micromonosporaceae bacterium]|nr:GNAT family N-acetyltransferase [Micromonosporaceae bacterium]